MIEIDVGKGLVAIVNNADWYVSPSHGYPAGRYRVKSFMDGGQTVEIEYVGPIS